MSLPRFTIAEPRFPITATAPATIRCIAVLEPGADEPDWIEWHTSVHSSGGPWTTVARNPGQDKTHTFIFEAAGTFWIRALAGNASGTYSTGLERRVTVSPAPQLPTHASSFKTVDGRHYLCADKNLPNARIVANRTAEGPWEIFQVIRLDSDRIALKADNGMYVCAESGGGGELVANRPEINPWEIFRVERHGNAVALRTDRGLYVSALNGGGGEVVADRTAVGPWEQFTASISGSSAPTPLVGQLRVMGRSYADGTGPRKVMFCSWFPAVRIWRDERDAARRQLDSIAAAGWQGVRVFTAVGGWQPFWDGREVAPVRFRKRTNEGEGDVVDGWPDYDDQLDSFLGACRDRGLKVHLTAGDLQMVMPQHEQRLEHARRVARIANRIGPDVVALYEVANEAWQNGFDEPDAARQVADEFRQHCPGPLRALSAPATGEEPDGLFAWSNGVDVCAVHGARRPFEHAAGRAFGLRYWDGNPNFFPKPFWQGEPTGPDGSAPEVFQPTNDSSQLFAIYAMHLMTGQASVFFNGPAVRYREPLDVTWGFRELPELLSVIPEDIGQWPNLSHGNKTTTPISAPVFADRGSGPARVDQAWSDSRIVCIAYGGIGEWNLFTRRELAWRVYSAGGLEREGRGPLPQMDASMTARLIVGEFL